MGRRQRREDKGRRQEVTWRWEGGRGERRKEGGRGESRKEGGRK